MKKTKAKDYIEGYVVIAIVDDYSSHTSEVVLSAQFESKVTANKKLKEYKAKYSNEIGSTRYQVVKSRFYPKVKL